MSNIVITKVVPGREHLDHVYVWLNIEGNVFATTGDPLSHEQALQIEKEELVSLRTCDTANWQGISQVYRDEHIYVVSSEDWLYVSNITRCTETLVSVHQTILRFPKQLDGKSLSAFAMGADGDNDLITKNTSVNFETLKLHLVQWTTGEHIVYLGTDGKQEIMLLVDNYIGYGEEFDLSLDYIGHEFEFFDEPTTEEEYEKSRPHSLLHDMFRDIRFNKQQ